MTAVDTAGCDATGVATPGQELAGAVALGGAARVEIAAPLTMAFPLAAHRPRYTVRHLLKVRSVVEEPVRYVTEAPDATAPPVSGVRYAETPEAGFRPSLVAATLTDLVAEVPLPAGVADDPELLATYVDHRVIVRLCTIENQALLSGTADGAIRGLLELPGLRRQPVRPGRDIDAVITSAAGTVEEMGGSCDGIVAHPDVYWELVRTGALGRLADAGVRVSRTRMIARDRILMGDLRAAVTLLEPHRSTLEMAAGRSGSDGVVRATQTVGLATHLPQHLLLLEGVW